MDIVSPRPAEVADDELHDRHEVDLSDERLRHRERVTHVAARHEVAVATVANVVKLKYRQCDTVAEAHGDRGDVRR